METFQILEPYAPVLTPILLVALVACGFFGAPLILWTILLAGLLAVAQAPLWLWAAFGVFAILFNIPPLRQVLISRPVMGLLNALKILPTISETEMTALKAGDVWMEGELFSGKPNFRKLMSQPYPKLSAEEQAFVDGPCDKLCQMVNDWNTYKNHDLAPEVWSYIKKEKFLGMIIPKEYGGLGFSALAHSEVIAKLSTRSLPLSISVMVPNSLGPAELLNHYGTAEQKKYYLPRLAVGEEVPCFALTEPNAGSDAASIQASGVVFKNDQGKLMIRLNWNKRWITLAAISTTLGLAFKLKDPENLLGKGEDVGITCALIPSKTPGVVLGRRHDPLGTPFFNCPTQGKDVVVPIDAIIGGVDMAGKGWLMLMESLAAGRGISLPAQATGAAKYISRLASAHATVRRQFGMSIGKFEGITEPLARITGWAYSMEAARRYTLGAIDGGVKPPVVTAIAKYYFTELQRALVNDGMDILGGQAISQGPKNLIANGYKALPISITVEGANILTRTLIIFGQGALRAHPYAAKEVDALARGDVREFDRAFWGHIGHVIRNSFRSVLLSLTRGWLAAPGFSVTAKYRRRLAWSSATFAIMADIAMGTLGGALKAKGKTTGRFADVLGWMYMATATLRRFEDEGQRKEDLPLFRWSMDYATAQMQKAFDGLFANMEAPLIGPIFRGPIRWYGSLNPLGQQPSDKLDFAIADLIQKNSEQRERLTQGIFLPKDPKEPLAHLELAFRLTHESDSVTRKVRKAVKAKKLKKQPAAQLYKDALSQGIITQPEFEVVAKAEEARQIAITVDDFDLKEYATMMGAGGANKGSASTMAASMSQV